MRRGYAWVVCALWAWIPAAAQPGVVAVRPAGNPGGKLLTMADAVYSRATYPERGYFRWDGDTLTRAVPERLPVSVRSGAANVIPKGNLAAYTVGNSLYVTDGEGMERCVARSEGPGIVYGQSVSRNEFGINGGIFWSGSGRKLAFYRKDESAVTEFPLIDITTRTGSLVSIRYPMNGMDSERIGLGVYDVGTGSTVWLDVRDFGEDRYLTNVTWSPDERDIYVQVVDRTQHHMRLNRYCAETGAFVRTLLTEDDAAWVEPQDPLHFLGGRSDLFLYRTDNRDGYRNLYLCDTLGGVRRLTAVEADVRYVGNDGRSVFYTSAEVSPVENHLFRIDVKVPRDGRLARVRIGAPVRLTSEEGWHTVSLNASCTEFLDRYSSLCVPGMTVRRSARDGRALETLLVAEDPLRDYAACEVDLGTVRSADGRYDNWYRLIKPRDFDPSRRYPVIVYVYGGPHSQMVRDTWLAEIRLWEMYMAERGYLVYVQDNRGTENRGAAYEKAINRACGQVEMADQMEGVRMLLSLPYVDASRIGVHGWSYGGFMTISLMTTWPEVFRVGVAGGPVIDWKWYEVMYGERYMDTPETNPEGFALTSLIDKAPRLAGRLLICQGAIDNTVVWEHSLSFVEACIKAGVQVDYFPYPTHEHNVRGADRVHLMDKVTRYFEDYL